MALVGYARVSSVGQSLDVQLDKLKDCDKIFQEKGSGLDRSRPVFKRCLEYIREGDTLIVTRLDRLARSMTHFCEIGEFLKKEGVNLKVIDQNIDTTDATGRLLFNMLGAISQFETEIRAERQADGINRARERGVHLGRLPKLTTGQIDQMRQDRADGVLIKELVQKYGISKSSVYRLLN